MTTPKSAIEKGKLLENFIVDKLIKSGLDTSASRAIGSGSGNREKRDIQTKVMIGERTLGIEAKNHKVPHIKEWWDQTFKLDKLGYFPALMFKLEREQYEDTKVVININDFIDLLLRASGKEIVKDDDIHIAKEDKWIVKRALTQLKELDKILSKN